MPANGRGRSACADAGTLAARVRYGIVLTGATGAAVPARWPHRWAGRRARRCGSPTGIHANVIRNQTQPTSEWLLETVHGYLTARNATISQQCLPA